MNEQENPEEQEAPETQESPKEVKGMKELVEYIAKAIVNAPAQRSSCRSPMMISGGLLASKVV